MFEKFQTGSYKFQVYYIAVLHASKMVVYYSEEILNKWSYTTMAVDKCLHISRDKRGFPNFKQLLIYFKDNLEIVKKKSKHKISWPNQF